MANLETLGFDEIYASVGVLGHTFSDRLVALDGRRVRMRGFLAPAGHGESPVLVLTREPVAPCSDCGGGHNFPDDAVFVLPAEDAPPAFAPGRETEVTGILEHGRLALPGAEAASLVRLRGAYWTEV